MQMYITTTAVKTSRPKNRNENYSIKSLGLIKLVTYSMGLSLKTVTCVPKNTEIQNLLELWMQSQISSYLEHLLVISCLFNSKSHSVHRSSPSLFLRSTVNFFFGVCPYEGTVRFWLSAPLPRTSLTHQSVMVLVFSLSLSSFRTISQEEKTGTVFMPFISTGLNLQ